MWRKANLVVGGCDRDAGVDDGGDGDGDDSDGNGMAADNCMGNRGVAEPEEEPRCLSWRRRGSFRTSARNLGKRAAKSSWSMSAVEARSVLACCGSIDEERRQATKTQQTATEHDARLSYCAGS